MLNLTWLQNTMMFGIRWGGHELKWSDIQLLEDETGSKHLEFNERDTKTRTGEITHPRTLYYNSTRLHDLSNCPVAAFKVFRDHKPPSTMTPDSPFYIVINHKCLQGSSIWYENQPLGENTLDEDKSFNTINYMHQLASCPYCNSTINWSQKRLKHQQLRSCKKKWDKFN